MRFFPLLGLALAGFAWRAYSHRARKFGLPSENTISDEAGHYDMDGVSFDDKSGVVVGSDGRTPRVKGVEKKTSGKLPRRAS